MLVAIDMAALFVAHAVAGMLRFDDPLDGQAMTLFAATVALYTFAAFVTNAYSVPVLLAAGESARRALKALAIALTASVFLFFLLQLGDQVSRAFFAAAALFAAVGVGAGRAFLGKNARTILGGEPYDVVVIADGMAGYPQDGCALYVEAAGAGDPANHNPDMFEWLGRLVEHADRVVIACTPERRLAWAAALQGANVQAEVIAPELATLRPLGIARHQGNPTMIVAKAPLALRDRIIKRGFDLVVAATLLTIAAVPIAMIALAIRLDGTGPVLFRQPRLGRRNRPFNILKFRTMRVADADAAGHRSAGRDDDRVTPVGRLLRATSLDELPQLLNVLSGEMSMVGPRPHALGSRAEDQLFWELDARYWHRHAIKPGLTGLAQVRGLRGATAARADLVDRLQADLEYRNDWSLWKDCAILLRTIPVLLHRNAF
jgi:exopolysaccharide biosynthesis polyprenyl glycosylphosphotransferase